MSSTTTKPSKTQPTKSKSVRRFSRLSPEVRRKGLIEAAIRSLGKHGSSSSTVDIVCREAGVSRGLISHYFGGKDELFVEAYLMISSQHDTLMREELKKCGDDPALRLKAIISINFNKEVFTQDSIAAWMAIWVMVRTKPTLQQKYEEVNNIYRKEITKIIEDISVQRDIDLDAALVARLICATVDGLWLDCCLRPDTIKPDEALKGCLAFSESMLGGAL